jgi:hypothetical protein
LSVENGVVISVFEKDYELMSWNEQGEIIQVKGMLTIAFLVVFLCSHIDSWKQLYLIVKIPYLVNMPLESIQDVEELILRKKLTDKEYSEMLDWMVSGYKGDTTWKNIKPHLDTLSQDYKNKIKRIKELESRVETVETASSVITENFEKLEKEVKLLLEGNKQQKEEVEKLKKENLRLKIVSGEAKSGWIKERDWIYRHDSKTGKPIGYRCPIDFELEKVEQLKIEFNVFKNEKWAEFYHPYPGYNLKSFDMPHTAYLWLKGELPEQKKEKLETKKMDIHSINSVQEMNKFIQSIDKDAKLHRKFFHQTANYLLRNRNSRIKFADYKKHVKFSGRQIGYDWLDDFQRWKFIKKVPNKKGYWDVIF